MQIHSLQPQAKSPRPEVLWHHPGPGMMTWLTALLPSQGSAASHMPLSKTESSLKAPSTQRSFPSSTLILDHSSYWAVSGHPCQRFQPTPAKYSTLNELLGPQEVLSLLPFSILLPGTTFSFPLESPPVLSPSTWEARIKYTLWGMLNHMCFIVTTFSVFFLQDLGKW
jgi:hypothetical protein